MEKTTHITIAGTLFGLTEAAYTKLAAYLESLKHHFVHEADRNEILRDIESRIAEKLLEKNRSIITEEDIAAVVREMGSAAELNEDGETTATPHTSGRRKLYRDTTDSWIGGVASGIAQYFDIDPLWVRLPFLVSIFFGGTGLILYVVLWIFVPEAKTSSQKLEMRGDPVNLESIARIVRENVEEARASGAPRKVIEGIHRVVRGFFRVLGKIVGSFLTVGAFFATIALLVGAGVIATNWNAPYNDFPLHGAVSDPLLIAGFAAGFVAILIPLVAVFALGLRLFSSRVVFPSVVAFGLIGVWALAISAGGTIAVKLAGEYFEYEQTNPSLQIESRSVAVAEFTSVKASDHRITIKEGPSQNVEIQGRIRDLDNAIISVENGTLIVRKTDTKKELCIFCANDTPDITITTPGLEKISAKNAQVEFDGFTDSLLAIELENGSTYGDLDVSNLALHLDNANVRSMLTVETLTLNAELSHLDLKGSVETAVLALSRSNFQGESLLIQNATLTTSDSTANLDVRGTFKKNDDSSSHVTLRRSVQEEN